MKRSQISYIKQKLQNLSKQDLIEFAKFNKVWIRQYWPKSEIADAIIANEREKTIPKLTVWAKTVGKEHLIFTPESQEFWKLKESAEEAKDEEQKTFSEEFLERWKRLSDKDKKPEPKEIKMPPRLTPARVVREEKPPEIPVQKEIDQIREKIRKRLEERRPEPPKPPMKPPEKMSVRYPPKIEPRKVEEPDIKSERYTPFKSQLEQLKERIVQRVHDIRDSDLLIKEELKRETEELDRFMRKEFEEKGIKVEEKVPDIKPLEPKPKFDKKDFARRLDEIEEKLVVRELKPSIVKKIPIDKKRAEMKAPPVEVKKEKVEKKAIEIPPIKEKEIPDVKKEEMELRAKFFDKYIKRFTAPEEVPPTERLPEEPLEIGVPISKQREVLSGRINGRGLINGAGTIKGLINGLSNGMINGRINGKGLINGLVMGKRTEDDEMKRRIRRVGLIRSRFKKRLVITGIVIFILFAVPIMVFMIPVPDGKGIDIDGKFNDWSDPRILNYMDSPDDQTINENINLLEFKLNEEGNAISYYIKVSGNIFEGRSFDEGVGFDLIRIFIDLDANIQSGYLINNIGADFMYEIYGYGTTISKSIIRKYEPSDSTQHDWNSWIQFSQISSAAGINELEVQYWFHKNINRSAQFYSFCYLQDFEGNVDTSDTIVSNLGKGALSIKQTRIDIDTLPLGWVDVLQLEFQAYGIPVTVFDLNFDFQYENDLLGFPSKLDLQPNEPVTITIQLNTRNIPQGALVEIGLTSRNQVETTADITTIGGIPAKYFVEQPPSEIAIDGAFGDWSFVETHTDDDNEQVQNQNINMTEYKFNIDSDSLNFYFKVNGSIMSGSMVPARTGYLSILGEDQVDSDDDGVPDKIDPFPNTNVDTDGDGWADDYETIISHTNSSNIDTDHDEVIDSKDPDPNDPNIPPIPEPAPLPLLLGKDTARIYIDTDQSALTGFKFVNIDFGAEILIELTGKYQYIYEKKMFSFIGETQYEWNWTPIGSVEAAIDSQRLESSVILNDINLEPGDSFRIYYVITDWSLHKDEANETLEYSPEGVLRVIGENISPGTRVRNKEIVGMLKLSLITNAQSAQIYSIETTLLGTYLPSDIVNILIFDDDGDGIFTNEDYELTRSRIGKSRNDQINLILSEELRLMPDVNKSIFIAIETNDSVRAGNTIGLQITSEDDIITNVKDVIGNFPLSSNLFTLENTSSRAPKAPKNPLLTLETTYAGPATVTQGDSNVLMLTFTMTASNGDVDVDSITLGHIGSGPASDITNVYLSGPMGTLTGTFGTFTFTPFTVSDGATVTLNVYFDISITARVGKTHGVKVDSLTTVAKAKISGKAEGSGKTDTLLIPEYPYMLLPILFMTVIFSGTLYRSRYKKLNKYH
ncbi:MAG: hypothetical protein JSV49_11660 [Thermoplasmata archaeon]|nr:MAG: hypothetical protein JSV49_11660 [Thermoplasmata archaeon]